MRKPTYLYRAVTTIETDEVFYEDGVEEYDAVEPGALIGRRSGYLSRSGARDAAINAGYKPDEFEIVRSEPVIFLTRRQRLEREIDRLRAELAATL